MAETGAACDIGEYHYVPPPRPQNCKQAWGDRVAFDHAGGPAFFGCHVGTFLGQLPTQTYDRPLSAGAIICEVNEVTGVTCRDTSTGHFFPDRRAVVSAGVTRGLTERKPVVGLEGKTNMQTTRGVSAAAVLAGAGAAIDFAGPAWPGEPNGTHTIT
jgi:hypothetical protein